jgi:GTPase SAR1 family protein
MAAKHYDEFKLVMVGLRGVGKSAITVCTNIQQQNSHIKSFNRFNTFKKYLLMYIDFINIEYQL